jgi:hypothetical protein
MIPEPMPSVAVGSMALVLVVLTILTTAGLTLAATSMIADDSLIFTGCAALVVWPLGTVALPATGSRAPLARRVR